MTKKIPVRIYTPDDPEFEEIAKTIRHVSKVRKGLSTDKDWISADRTPLPRRRHRRNINDLTE